MAAIRRSLGNQTISRKLGIDSHLAAVGIATAVLLWCNGSLAADTRAILLRGYLGLFSDGLDRLAEELRARGINAEVRKHLYWTTAVSDILRERAAGKVGALILRDIRKAGTTPSKLRGRSRSATFRWISW